MFRRAMWQAGDPTNSGRRLEIAAISNVWKAALSAGSIFQPAALQSRFLLGLHGDGHWTRTWPVELGRRAKRTRIRRAANGAERNESSQLEDCRWTSFCAGQLGVGGADKILAQRALRIRLRRNAHCRSMDPDGGPMPFWRVFRKAKNTIFAKH